MKFDLDLLRSHHVLLRMFSRLCFKSPKPFFNFPSERAFKRIRNGQNGPKFAPRLWGGCATVGGCAERAEFSLTVWRGCANGGAGAPTQQPASFSITFDSRIRLLRL